jgi:hypothetical protein
MDRIEELTSEEIEQMAVVGDTTVHGWGWRSIVQELCRRVRALEKARDEKSRLPGG